MYKYLLDVNEGHCHISRNLGSVLYFAHKITCSMLEHKLQEEKHKQKCWKTFQCQVCIVLCFFLPWTPEMQ